MKNPKPNLSKGEQKATEELAKRKDIIITNIATTRSYKKTQRYNTVIWLTIQLTGLKKKIYFLKNCLMD